MRREQVPLPRPDPRRQMTLPMIDVPRASLPLEEQLGYPNMRQIGIQMHYDHPRYPHGSRPDDDERLLARNAATERGIGSRVNPMAFDRMLQNEMPSTNIEDLRAVTPNYALSQTPQQIPTAPGWEWANPNTFRWAMPGEPGDY
jgi:hypothetical protein